MLDAAWWGFVGGAALLLGGLTGVYLPLSTRFVGMVMGFGAGALVSALAFELTSDAYDLGGGVPVVAGLLVGAAAFYSGDWLIDRRGGHRRKSPVGMQAGAGSLALVLGAVWVAVTLASTAAATLGFAALDGAPPELTAAILAFAAGAILTMLSDTMVPEAVEHAGPSVGLVTVLGFTAAFLLSIG